MEESCVSNQAINGEHDGEYYETVNGEVWEKCTNCDSLFFARYHDVGSGC